MVMKSPVKIGLLVFAGIALLTAVFYASGPHRSLLTGRSSAVEAATSTIATSTDTKLDITAQAYGVYDLNGNEIIGNNVNEVWPLASITKLMTAEVATQLIATDTPIEITSSTLDEVGGDRRVQIGQIYSLSEIMKLMLVMSDNASAQAIADHYGNSEFIAAMNAEAKSLGMNQTTYADSVGLSNGSVGTVADTAKLVSYLWNNNKKILDLTTIATGYVHPENNAAEHFIINIDQLSGHPDFLGGKTGTTPDAKDNIVAVLHRGDVNGGQPFIVAVFGSTNRYADVSKIISAIPQ